MTFRLLLYIKLLKLKVKLKYIKTTMNVVFKIKTKLDFK